MLKSAITACSSLAHPGLVATRAGCTASRPSGPMRTSRSCARGFRCTRHSAVTARLRRRRLHPRMPVRPHATRICAVVVSTEARATAAARARTERLHQSAGPRHQQVLLLQPAGVRSLSCCVLSLLLWCVRKNEYCCLTTDISGCYG